MLSKIHSKDRILIQDEWLYARHHFNMQLTELPGTGWGRLKVFNDDIIEPQFAFEMHPHHNMDIFTYVLEGILEHRDSLGNRFLLHPGQLLLMHCGKGIMHAELNPSNNQSLRVLQVWVQPQIMDTTPHCTFFQTLPIYPDPLISPDSRMAKFNSKTKVYLLQNETQLTVNLNNKKSFLYILSGEMHLSELHLQSGDTLLIQDESEFYIISGKFTAILILDL